MYPFLIELLRQRMPGLSSPVVCIVDHNLAPTFEEIPDELFASIGNLLSEFYSLCAFLS